MPKVKPLGEYTADNEALVKKIRHGKAEHNLNDTKLSEAVNICRSTFSDRMKKPETFTLKELRRVSKVLHIPLVELINGVTQ